MKKILSILALCALFSTTAFADSKPGTFYHR